MGWAVQKPKEIQQVYWDLLHLCIMNACKLCSFLDLEWPDEDAVPWEEGYCKTSNIKMTQVWSSTCSLKTGISRHQEKKSSWENEFLCMVGKVFNVCVLLQWMLTCVHTGSILFEMHFLPLLAVSYIIYVLITESLLF